MIDDNATADSERPHAVGAPVERPVRPLYENIRELALERASGGPSSEDGTYDPELLDALITAADALERAEQALRGMLAACEALAGQQAMPDDFWRMDAHMAGLALRAISPAA